MASVQMDNESLYYDQLHAEKYRDKDQSFNNHCKTMAKNMCTDDIHAAKLEPLFLSQKFLPAGRVQAAMGATEREVSAFNCSVSMTIEDDINSIMQAASNAAKILRLGTGIGYNFSNLRPKGALIRKLQTEASGPVSFMRIFEAVASTIASSGHRRGAQMAIMNISHPDIEEFIDAKLVSGAFRHFNFSVGVSDSFMECLKVDGTWDLTFGGKVYKTVKAADLWKKIMTNAYNSAEPGVIFLDRINKENNLWYCEDIEATNPCSEQPLPANGLCLLGSFNLTKYMYSITRDGKYLFDENSFVQDVYAIVEAYDNIFDRTVYAIPEHEEEANSKRRMGIGLTGIANAIELLTNSSYGTYKFNTQFKRIAKLLRDTLYRASIKLAQKRGSFFHLNVQDYLASSFAQRLPDDIRRGISAHGIRNSHLISYAPCGTISQVAGNVSSGIEPIFYHQVERDVHMKAGKTKVTLSDYNVKKYGFKGKTLEECSIEDHISVAAIAQDNCDSAVSKTINVPETCTYTDYQDIYIRAYKAGSKGITVFRPTELRGSVITAAPKEKKKEFVYGGSGSCVDGVCSIS